jgi:photosystem II stability/assembly factor-like uncharacterized protein/phage anti-repressor protein
MPTFGQQYKADAYAGMRWRLIGPHRAGRVTAVAGIRGRPGIYYMGTPGGGVWKTTDGGQVWKPIFDEARVASIGALAVAPSNPQIIYVGTGEQTEGNGVYKSTDAGATWTNIGLGETRYISSIIVDPRDPNIVLVGVSGKPVPGQMRGIFKTTDGGKSWNKVFFKDDRTGVVDMCAAPGDSRIVYAATWTRQFDVNEPRPALDAQIFKSTDAGATWRALGESGLPSKLRGRIGVVVAPGDKRVYAIMNQGFFRSDDGGESWTQSTKDPRVVGSGYFSRVYVDPKRADVVYVMQTTMYRSVDGGKTFEAYRGAPSGEDEHVIWIDPDDTERMILGTDQGAIVSLNGGQSWSLWYNQPTGQFYHVITDKEFPYYAYASQQDSGSVVVPNRSDFGEITFRDWFSTGSFESGYIAPDPLDANLIYSIGWFGTVLKMDRTTKQISTMFIPGPKYRFTWETPIVFSPKEPKNLYLGMQHVLRSTDGAATWREISPDLTERPAAPAALKNHADDEEEEQPQSADRGVIQAIAPSPLEAGEIWVGTSTGLVQLTTDGGATWRNVTPRELPARSRVFLIEPSVRDAETAYAVAAARNDLRPHIYRTRDGGKNWQQIVAGLPERGIARVVREDPVRKGLAYAGTENGAYVSFDAGDHWQPLQLNLPTASVRDLTVHESDLVAATYGRGLWILDNLSPLRQLDAKALAQDVHLFRPETALRVRWDNWQETPLSAETPAGQNPPDGAIIDYYLKSSTAKEITLEIRDERGNVVRRYSSAEPPQETAPKNVPEFWFAPPARLTTKAGLNRFVWDLRYPHPATLPYGYSGQRLDYIEYTVPDNAIPGQTPSQQPPGPLVAPGKYEAVLTVEGKTYRQPLVVVLDPRVRVSTADLEAQLNLARKISGWMTTSYDAYFEVEALQSIAAQRQKSLAGNSQAKDVADALTALEKELVEIKDGASGAAGVGTVNRDLARYMAMIESGDTRPPESARNNTVESCDGLGKSMERWRKVNTDSLPVLNKLLAQHGLAGLPVVAPAATPACLN